MPEKYRKDCHRRGIFTATQLSYTFRPPRRLRRLPGTKEKYHYSLKALAIRDKKIYIVGKPEIKLEGTPVYFDVEGLHDRCFYYLIGARVVREAAIQQHSFWANTLEEEGTMWHRFLHLLADVENPVLIHYGSYEAVFLKRMSEKHGGAEEVTAPARVLSSLVNVLSVIYASVYFPTHGNGLKDIAKFLGFKWAEPEASGLSSMMWRLQWEHSRRPDLKERLLRYNADDCEALHKLTRFITHIGEPKAPEGAPTSPEMVHTDLLPKRNPFGFGQNDFLLPELEQINRAAYWDYQREHIFLRSKRPERKQSGEQATPMAPRRSNLKVNKVIAWPRPKECPSCKGKVVYKHVRDTKTVLDLRFTSAGVKRWVVRHEFYRYRCPACGCVFGSCCGAWGPERYGPNVRIMATYQMIDLGLPQMRVAAFFNEVLRLPLLRQMINKLKIATAAFYEPTCKQLLEKITTGKLIHADETIVNLTGATGYVWVLTSLDEVVYLYKPCRKADWIQPLLKDFRGVLVSDFYTAYDAVPCSQQKCLIHLIRDLNDDLAREPFNNEIKFIVKHFASLLRRIIETVDRFGLKTYHLSKHKADVEAFFTDLSKRDFCTETAAKTKARLEKYQSKLFTFLHFDGIPWNNNNAEHAIKAFVLLRKGLGGVSSERGIADYLTLLSVCETCRFKRVSFLDFLKSGEKDIEGFKNRRYQNS
jgi:hypothetical protein